MTDSWKKQAEHDMELDVRLDHHFGKNTFFNFMYLFVPYLIPNMGLKQFSKLYMVWQEDRVENQCRQIKMMPQAS